MFSWCQGKGTDAAEMSPCHPICGYDAASQCAGASVDARDTGIGFRPVLEPLGFESPVPNYTLEGHNFQFNAICDLTNLLPTLQPAEKDVFANIPDGYKIRMYAFLKDGKPVSINTPEKHELKEKRQLELTDRYYGDEYLVPWTISNGIAISDKSFSLAT